MVTHRDVTKAAAAKLFKIEMRVWVLLLFSPVLLRKRDTKPHTNTPSSSKQVTLWGQRCKDGGESREDIFIEAVCSQCDERWHLDTVHTYFTVNRSNWHLALRWMAPPSPQTCTDMQKGCASPIHLILSLAADGHSNSSNCRPLVSVLNVRFCSCEDDSDLIQCGK